MPDLLSPRKALNGPLGFVSVALGLPSGSQDALAECHAYIKETLLSALDGLDSEGLPDPNKRETLPVTLALRAKIDVQVPIFYLRAGRALHTIEDSFTHSFRNVDDPARVTVVLNWIDPVRAAG